jgi:adenosylcobinamide amidohydrolase
MTYRIPQFGVIGYYNTQAGVAAQIDLLAQAYGTTTDTIYLHIEVDPQGIVYSSINFTETRAC